MNISLADKKISFKDFEKSFGYLYAAKPKEDIKADYERLTGQKVGSKQANKSSKKV